MRISLLFAAADQNRQKTTNRRTSKTMNIQRRNKKQ